MNQVKLVALLAAVAGVVSCDSNNSLTSDVESIVYSAVVVDLEIVRTVDGVPVTVDVPTTAANLIERP